MYVFIPFQPERIDPHHSSRGYDVRSDIWSLGITLVRQHSILGRVATHEISCINSCIFSCLNLPCAVIYHIVELLELDCPVL